MKIKLIDKKGWEKIISVKGKPARIDYPISGSKMLVFELFDVPKKGLPIFKEKP